MSKADLKAIAASLDDAAKTGTAIAQISDLAGFDLDEAYEIQRLSIERRLGRGETRVGVKMGFTSRAKMEQMGLSDMIWGRLTSAMHVDDGGEIEIGAFVHPRVEPEIAFLLKKPLEGPVTPMQALAAVEAVAPAMEIIDSRYENFKFTLEDVVADNCSSSAFVIGQWHRPDTDLGNLGMIMSFDGTAVQVGSSAAILGHPVRALAAASRMAGADGERLEAGYIIMAGGATPAVELASGTWVAMNTENLGAVGFSVA